MNRVIWTLIAAVVAISGLTARGAETELDLPLLSPECVFETEGKVVVVGETFVDYAGFLRILSSQDLIDHNNNWIAEDAHLVQTGNILPRSDDWKRLDAGKYEHEKIARYLMKLQKQAHAQGGEVHVLQGMLETLYQRWRLETVPIGLETIWSGPDSQERANALSDRWFKDYEPNFATLAAPERERLNENFFNYMKGFYQPGCVEMLERFGKYAPAEHRFVLDTEFAQWFRSLNTVIMINGVIYSHVGISPKMAGFEPGNRAPAMSLQQINDLLRERNCNPSLFLPIDADMDGPIWWRKMSVMADGDLDKHAEQLLQIYNAKALVIGLGRNDMVVRHGSVFMVRSGLGAMNFRTKLSLLVIEDDHWTIIEERRAIEEGDFEPVVLPGGPENPIKPGGGPPKMHAPGDED